MCFVLVWVVVEGGGDLDRMKCYLHCIHAVFIICIYLLYLSIKSSFYPNTTVKLYKRYHVFAYHHHPNLA